MCEGQGRTGNSSSERLTVCGTAVLNLILDPGVSSLPP